jgi:hypothetical protein
MIVTINDDIRTVDFSNRNPAIIEGEIMNRLRVKTSLPELSSTELASEMFESSHDLVTNISIFETHSKERGEPFTVIFKGKAYTNKEELLALLESKVEDARNIRDLCSSLKQVVIF